MEYNLGWNFLQVRFKISSWLWRVWKLGFILIALQSFNQQKGKLGNRLSFLNPKLMENIRDFFFSLQHNLWTENHNQAVFVFTVIIINTKENNSSCFSAYSHLYWVTHELKRDPDRPHQCLVFLSPLFHRSHLILSRAPFPSMTFPGSPNSVSFTVPGSTAQHTKLNHSAFHTAQEMHTLFNCSGHMAQVNNFRNLLTFI